MGSHFLNKIVRNILVLNVFVFFWTCFVFIRAHLATVLNDSSKRYAWHRMHLQCMTSFVNIYDVKCADNRYVLFNCIKMKELSMFVLNMTCNNMVANIMPVNILPPTTTHTSRSTQGVGSKGQNSTF